MIVSRISIIIYAVGALLVLSAIFTLVNAVWLLPAARNEGREIERADALKKSMELIKERNRTNEKVGKLDDPGLCAALDGKWVLDHCE